jgi:anti-anti-sigma factor
MLGELRTEGAMTVVTLHGDLDLVTVDELRHLLAEAVAAGPELVVDLSQVAFVDLVSLSVILAAADTLRAGGGSLVVVGASPATQRVCALLNASDILLPTLPAPRSAVH